ncbi:MAG: hypothetical protein Q8P58_00880 [Candidatus Adlerbacteria bacterium]|nr:hypothetical protein [Candidatus Adlerbacteria bacterium]
MTPEVIPGFIVLLLGGLMAMRPDLMMRFQIWTQKVIMSAQYIPSQRTYTIMRLMGVGIVVIGLAIIVGIVTES